MVTSMNGDKPPTDQAAAGRHPVGIGDPPGDFGATVAVLAAGLQGAGYRWAFGHHKAVERLHAINKSIHSETWVAKVLRHECRAIGLGLGRDEWGLHWPLVQRARDRAGRKPERPFTSFNEIRGWMPIGVGHSGHPSWEAAIRAALSDD